MRYGIIADIHSNLEAFQQVLHLLDSVDTAYCLGDIVGYGPNPSACIELLQNFDNITVAGNHDLCCAERISVSGFNSNARDVCLWTKHQLTQSAKKYLKDLPLRERTAKDILLVHGSPQNPAWEYLVSPKDAEDNFINHDFHICFVGHTHLPIIFQAATHGSYKAMQPKPNALILLNREMRYIINVGSVGQPRDGDPRASFVLFDDDTYTLQFFRVAYPVEKVQEKMRREGLPQFLIERLSFGM